MDVSKQSPITQSRRVDSVTVEFKAPLEIIRLHCDHLSSAYEQLSTSQTLALIEAIRTQTIVLEHLLGQLDQQADFEPVQD